MLKIIVCGAMGRMGINIANIVKNDPKTKISGAVEMKGHELIGKAVTGKVKLVDDLKQVINDGDVVIDFTGSRATIEHLIIAEEAKKPFIVGATGFSAAELKQIRNTSSKIPCVMAPNWSVGMNLLFNMVGRMAETFEDYDVEIIETHHNRKKDAPSGTAYRLAENIAGAMGAGKMVFGRKGKEAGRNPGEIAIHAVRGGGVIGDHMVLFAGEDERIEIIHRAHSRQCFGNGAVRAAKWVVSKPAGLYDMKDVLNLR